MAAMVREDDEEWARVMQEARRKYPLGARVFDGEACAKEHLGAWGTVCKFCLRGRDGALCQGGRGACWGRWITNARL